MHNSCFKNNHKPNGVVIRCSRGSIPPVLSCPLVCSSSFPSLCVSSSPLSIRSGPASSVSHSHFHSLPSNSDEKMRRTMNEAAAGRPQLDATGAGLTRVAVFGHASLF